MLSSIFVFELVVHDVSHDELLDLAGDGGGELINDLDIPRDLEVRQLQYSTVNQSINQRVEYFINHYQSILKITTDS